LKRREERLCSERLDFPFEVGGVYGPDETHLLLVVERRETRDSDGDSASGWLLYTRHHNISLLPNQSLRFKHRRFQLK